MWSLSPHGSSHVMISQILLTVSPYYQTTFAHWMNEFNSAVTSKISNESKVINKLQYRIYEYKKTSKHLHLYKKNTNNLTHLAGLYPDVLLCASQWPLSLSPCSSPSAFQLHSHVVAQPLPQCSAGCPSPPRLIGPGRSSSAVCIHGHAVCPVSVQHLALLCADGAQPGSQMTSRSLPPTSPDPWRRKGICPAVPKPDWPL